MKPKNRIIPKFERLHSPEYQALIMVDNSQGHAAYPVDTLLVTRMNFNANNAQTQLQNWWFTDATGQQQEKSMIFSPDHPKIPDQSKGMKQVLTE